MDFIVGLRTKDFVIMASDRSYNQSIVRMKDDADRIYQLGNNQLLNICGESGMDAEFAEFISKNYELYFYKNGYRMSPKAVASYARVTLANAIRSQDGPYAIHALIGGFDEHTKEAQLYFLDYLGSKVELPFGCHGYGSYFSLSILDRYYNEDMTEDEALDVLDKIVRELKKRLIVSIPELLVKVVRADNSIRQLSLFASS